MKRESSIAIDHHARLVVVEETDRNSEGTEWRQAVVCIAVDDYAYASRPMPNGSESWYKVDDPERAAIAFEWAAKMIRQFMRPAH